MAFTAGGMALAQGMGAAHAKPTVKQDGKTVTPSGSPTSPDTVRIPDGKQSFYVRTDSANAVVGAVIVPDAKCDDEDDIAFSSSCYALDGKLVSERMVHWTTNQRRAAVQCRFFNDTTQTLKVEAHIFCLRNDADD